MSVLPYGMSHNDGLLCDHPTCRDVAEWRLVTQQAGPDREVFACKAHKEALLLGKRTTRIEALDVPGNRNRPGVM